MTGEPAIDWTSFALGVIIGFVLCFLLFRRKGAARPPAPPTQPIELPPDLQGLVRLYRAEGRTIEAIKLVRERMGCDMRTAKFLVDHLR